MTRTAAWTVATVVAATALALVVLPLASREPSLAIAGPEVVTRWATWAAAIATFSVAALARRGDAVLVLAVAAASVVLAEELVNPAAGGWLLQLGLAALGSIGALTLLPHVLLIRPARSRGRRTAAALLTVVLVCGLLASLWLDPRELGCHACAAAPLALGSAPAVADAVALAASLVTMVTAAWLSIRTLRAAASIRRPEVVGALVASATAVLFAAPRVAGGAVGVLTGTGRMLGALGILVSALALLWPRVQRAQRRRALARLIGRLADAPRPGRLQDALAELLKDPTVRLGYLVEDATVDLDGDPFVHRTGSVTTDVRRGDALLVRVDHLPGTFEDASAVEMVASVAALAFEYEREAARLAASSRALAAARRDLIARADRERETLELELHDYTQARLVSIMVQLRLLAGQGTSLDTALAEVQSALDGVREIGRSVPPPTLASDGLAGALEELAVAVPAIIEVRLHDEARPDPVVEATVYLVVAALATTEGATIAVTQGAGALSVSARGASRGTVALEALKERTVAVGGSWDWSDDTLEASFPCAS